MIIQSSPVSIYKSQLSSTNRWQFSLLLENHINKKIKTLPHGLLKMLLYIWLYGEQWTRNSLRLQLKHVCEKCKYTTLYIYIYIYPYFYNSETSIDLCSSHITSESMKFLILLRVMGMNSLLIENISSMESLTSRFTMQIDHHGHTICGLTTSWKFV